MMSNFFGKVAVLAYVHEGWAWYYDTLFANSIIRNSIIATVVTIICFAWYAKIFIKIKPPLPPGPLGLPIIGNFPFIRPDLHRYFSELSQVYGPISKLQLGSKIWIVINSASVAKEVLKDQDAIFANHDAPAAAIAGTFGGVDMLWRHNSPEFNRLRKIVVREIMSKRSLDTCYELRRCGIRQMVNNIYKKVGSTSTIEVGEELFLTTLHIMIKMLWGGSLDGEEGSKLGTEVRKRLAEFVGLMGAPNISDIFPVFAPLDLQGIQAKAKKNLLWFYEIFESEIKNRREGKENDGESKDFLQQLLGLSQDQGGDDETALSITQVKALLLDIMIGSSDTIPTTVEWAMTELIRHNDKMNKVTEELELVVGKENIVEESHIAQLPYLEAVVKETLRMYPAAPLLVPHIPNITCTVAGYTIPKHSTIFINAWAIQRDLEFWEHPLEFQPERFLKKDSGNYKGNNFHFFPFGSGRRICVGMPLAEKMVAHLLAVLVHSFDWKLPKETKLDTKERLRFVLAKAEPLAVIPVPRLPFSWQYQ